MSAPRISAVVSPDGRTSVHVGEPVGPACDDADAELRVVLELLGAGVGDVTETSPRRTRVPDGSPDRQRELG